MSEHRNLTRRVQLLPNLGGVNLFLPWWSIQLRYLPRAPLLFADRHYPSPKWRTWGPWQLRVIHRRRQP